MYRIDVVRHFCLHWSLNMVLIVWNKFVQKRPSLELFPCFHPPQYYYIINSQIYKNPLHIFQLRKHFYAYYHKTRIFVTTQIFHPVPRLRAFCLKSCVQIKNLYLTWAFRFLDEKTSSKLVEWKMKKPCSISYPWYDCNWL